MAYSKRVWTDSPLEMVTFEDCNRWEEGIESNDKAIADIKDTEKEGSIAKKIADAEEQINVLSTKSEIQIPFSSGYAQSDAAYACKITKYSLGYCEVTGCVKKTDGTSFSPGADYWVAALPEGYVNAVNTQVGAAPCSLIGGYYSGAARATIYGGNIVLNTSVECPAIFFQIRYEVL